jgi:hypothetical protein
MSNDEYGYSIDDRASIPLAEIKANQNLYGRKMRLTIILAVDYDTETSEGMSAYVDEKVNLSADINTIVIEMDGVSKNCQRVTFDIDYPGLSGWYYSEISIYNFNESTLMQVIKEGAGVKLEAGYVNGNYGLLFEGYVFQALYERENITDYKLTLRCTDGNRLFTQNFAALSLDSGRNNQLAIFNAIHVQAQQKMNIKKTTEKLDTENHPRGTTIFTTPARALNKLIQHYNLTDTANTCMFTEGGETVVFDIGDPPDPNAIQVSPDGQGGLIGTPIQTQYGCDFTVLLNAHIRLTAPRKLVKINNSQIRGIKARQGVLLSPLDEDTEYQVIGVRHEGDTRGDQWYTHVTGINAAGAQALQQTTTKWSL